jgi:nucleotide-binding universal stress UspA family protein
MRISPPDTDPSGSVDPVRGVVVGVDGSEPSLHALRWSAFLAHSMQLGLTAIIAWEPIGRYGWATAGWAAPPVAWDPAVAAKSALDDAVEAAFGSSPPTELTTSVREGNPARVLLGASAGADMLVLGTRGHGGFAGLLLGSVSQAVAEHAKCPVLVARDGVRTS